jgi:hypothetical protein
MVRIMALMVRLPLDILATSMELMAHAIRELQDNLDPPERRPAAPPALQPPPSYLYFPPPVPPAAVSREPTPVGTDPGPRSDVIPAIPPTPKEVRPMPDRDLSGDDLKLVRYKVLFTKRDSEHAFPEREELVYDDMDGTRFVAWKIAEFVQTLRNEDASVRRVPDRLAKYLISTRKQELTPAQIAAQAAIAPGAGVVVDWEYLDERREVATRQYLLKHFPEKDKKYLRLFFEVLDRFPREDFKHEERQIEVLEQIRDKMP